MEDMKTMSFSFEVPGPPAGKSRVFTTRDHNRRGRGFLTAKTYAFQKAVAFAAQAALPPDWPRKHKYGVWVKVVAVFPRPKYLKRPSAPPGRLAYLKKPDLDNIIKAVCDGAKWVGVYSDDSQVRSYDGSDRFFAALNEQPHTEVTITLLPVSHGQEVDEGALWQQSSSNKTAQATQLQSRMG